jgi:uncharacterized surface protein with fasciclin (FAS1) repeats
MRTRTQLLFSVLGLTLFISLPVLAQKKPTEGSNTTPPSVEQTVPTTPNPSVQEQEKPASSTQAAPDSSNLVDTAANSKDFQTLAKAIKAAGLEETLAGEGPYTVFAPTDAAFAALPSGILDQLLLPENKEILVALLKSHVVSGAVTSSQIQPGSVETLAGAPVAVKRGEDGIVTVNNAKVTQADIQASNGVIHAIDKVILPQDAQSQSQTAPQPSGQSQK